MMSLNIDNLASVKAREFGLHVHNVTSISVETETVGLDGGNGYLVHRIDIHAVDHRDEEVQFRVTLYGKIGDDDVPEVPFNFSKVEEVMP